MKKEIKELVSLANKFAQQTQESEQPKQRQLTLEKSSNDIEVVKILQRVNFELANANKLLQGSELPYPAKENLLTPVFDSLYHATRLITETQNTLNFR